MFEDDVQAHDQYLMSYVMFKNDALGIQIMRAKNRKWVKQNLVCTCG